ncbi:MAG: hypothetical protein AB9Q22_01035 [Candidatus Reddybacter sp.]
MKFDLVGLEDSYGNHRFSNNTILKELADKSKYDASVAFIWWIEKIFTQPDYHETVKRLAETDWFGVMHVPLLTPNWAQYSQNDLAKLYFSEEWRQALKRCRGVIALSEHMKVQLKSIYPELKVFSLKHPVGSSEVLFKVDEFYSKPTVLLVGAWLRDFESFIQLKSNFDKKVLLNKYAEGYLRDVYSRYSVNILAKVRQLDCVSFLEDQAYDELFSSSLIFIGLHETSANNAVCECISYGVPFVAPRHPAIIEYVGEDYPLLYDDVTEVSRISIDDVVKGHEYLQRNTHLKESLSLDKFVHGVSDIYKEIFEK